MVAGAEPCAASRVSSVRSASFTADWASVADSPLPAAPGAFGAPGALGPPGALPPPPSLRPPDLGAPVESAADGPASAALAAPPVPAAATSAPSPSSTTALSGAASAGAAGAAAVADSASAASRSACSASFSAFVFSRVGCSSHAASRGSGRPPSRETDSRSSWATSTTSTWPSCSVPSVWAVAPSESITRQNGQPVAIFVALVDRASSTRSMLIRLPTVSSIHMRAPPAPQHMDRWP